MENEITFQIIKPIGVIKTNQCGWSKELNIVSWNKGIPKFDIREWNPEHDRMTRGITFLTDEAENLAKILTEYFEREK